MGITDPKHAFKALEFIKGILNMDFSEGPFQELAEDFPEGLINETKLKAIKYLVDGGTSTSALGQIFTEAGIIASMKLIDKANQEINRRDAGSN